MRNAILATAAAIVAMSGAATAASAATVFSEDFQGVPTSTVAGNVLVSDGTPYAICCGVTGQSGNVFAAFGGGNAPSGTVSFTLNTVVGRLYTVNFDYGALAGSSGLDDPLTLNVGAGPTNFFATSSVVDLGSAFSAGSYSFTGTGSPTLISFSSHGADNVDAVLDNISITAAPEPATWALMVLGFGAVGAALRRRTARKPAFV